MSHQEHIKPDNALSRASRFIGNGRHRLLIGEHPDKGYIASYVDDVVIGGFFTADQLMEAAAEFIDIARHIRKRSKG